jgi:hypothetical protein
VISFIAVYPKFESLKWLFGIVQKLISTCKHNPTTTLRATLKYRMQCKKKEYVPVSNVLEEKVQKKQKTERFQKSINILTHCIRKFDVNVENYET